MYLAISSGIESVSPAVAMVPVEAPPHGEVLVLGAWVCNISNKCVDILLVLLEPFGIKMAKDRTGQNMVAIVEMMIVVQCVAEVGACVPSHVCCG